MTAEWDYPRIENDINLEDERDNFDMHWQFMTW